MIALAIQLFAQPDAGGVINRIQRTLSLPVGKRVTGQHGDGFTVLAEVEIGPAQQNSDIGALAFFLARFFQQSAGFDILLRMIHVNRRQITIQGEIIRVACQRFLVGGDGLPVVIIDFPRHQAEIAVQNAVRIVQLERILPGLHRLLLLTVLE